MRRTSSARATPPDCERAAAIRKPPLTTDQILTWSDEYFARTGRWPNRLSGPVSGSAGESWCAIDMALIQGLRGLPGGQTLARLLAGRRGAHYRSTLSPLTTAQILRWADDHRSRFGTWPNLNSGAIAGQDGLTWGAVNAALRSGARGLDCGGTLAQLLARCRDTRNLSSTPPLHVEQILAWADAYHEATGAWPHHDSGPVAGAPGESWNAIDRALRRGSRGLPGNSSLARLLNERRGVRNKGNLPRLTVRQLVAWARAHRARTGEWPGQRSGPIAGAEGETWRAVEMALVQGHRGLKGGSSLAKLLGTVKEKRTMPGVIAAVAATVA